MPNYRETTGVGTSWLRASHCICDNSEGRRLIRFEEELVYVTPDGHVMRAPTGGGCTEFLTAENENTPFALLDQDGNPTGQSATYAQVYQILKSLYYHVATLRDQAEAGGNV